MDSERARDDLKAIRQVMDRTRRTAGRHGGWFMVVWGIVWFVGFLGTQFLPDRIVLWFWQVLTLLGAIISVWIGIRVGRGSDVRSSILRPLILWWLALIVFDVLLAWLFGLHTDRDLTLLIVLTVALSYFQFGLFTHWAISLVGALLAVLTVAAALLLPEYLSLAMAFLGGGVLTVSGLLFIRHADGE